MARDCLIVSGRAGVDDWRGRWCAGKCLCRLVSWLVFLGRVFLGAIGGVFVLVWLVVRGGAKGACFALSSCGAFSWACGCLEFCSDLRVWARNTRAGVSVLEVIG